MSERGDALPKCGCGGEPVIHQWPKTGYANIECNTCSIGAGGSLDECVTTWTRAMSAAPPAMADERPKCYPRVGFKRQIEWPDPTPEMLNDPVFEAIWQTIKSWDVNVPEAYGGYCHATGNHVRAILDALPPAMARPSGAEALRQIEHYLTQIMNLEIATDLEPGFDHRNQALAEAQYYARKAKAALAGAAQPGMGDELTPPEIIDHLWGALYGIAHSGPVNEAGEPDADAAWHWCYDRASDAIEWLESKGVAFPTRRPAPRRLAASRLELDRHTRECWRKWDDDIDARRVPQCICAAPRQVRP